MNFPMVRKVIYKVFPTWSVFLKGLIRFSSTYGYYKSIKEKRPVDINGNPIPWYTYPGIEYLEQLDFSKKTIFEYSSGYGSIWWSDRCKQLISVEHNPEWFQEVDKMKKDNHLYTLQEDKTAYVNHLDKYAKTVDVVIIDGEYRSSCAKKVLELVETGSGFELVIFDNSDWWPNAVKSFKDQTRFYQIDFHGMGPINAYSWTTSIFFPKVDKSNWVQKLNYSKNALLIKSDDDNALDSK